MESTPNGTHVLQKILQSPIMEKRAKLSRNERERFEKRSPLQRLNGLQIRKPKTSNLSSSSSSSASSSASVSLESPNGGSRFLPSLNSSSSRTHNTRNLPTVSHTASLKSPALASNPRSKENEVPQIPFSEKPTKNRPLRLDKTLCGEANRKPTIENGQRSKLRSAQANPKLKNCEGNGSGEVPIKLFGESCERIDSNCIENCTPEGKMLSAYGSDSVSIDYVRNIKDGPISKTAVKTPPVEASVSPNLQYGSHSKTAVLKSAATPVCYGAGHLLSGVTDKRKCRRRGSLKGGCEKVDFFHDENNCENGIIDSADYLIPLPSEASFRWLLSPCDEDSENRSEQCDAIGDSAFGCDKSDKEMHENLLLTTPNPVSNCNNVIENNSAFSLGSLSSGNIIQAPPSDSSSYGCLRGSEAELDQFELDSILQSLNKLCPSPISVSLLCADMDLSSSVGLSQVHENANSVCSWVSESTVENLALSQTRISWRDGFFSNIDENDELDCCRCLSDEEIDDNRGSGRGGHEENDLPSSSCLRSCNGTEPGEIDTRIYKDGLQQIISSKGNVKLPSHRLNESAESMCTNGGSLVASGDSGWMYFQQNHLV